MKENQKGVALYISLIIMAILLAMGLEVAIIIIGETRIMRNIGDSVVAFQAADSGIENALYNERKLNTISSFGPELIGESSYSVEYDDTDIAVELWRSIGTYKGEKRAIQIDQPRPFDFSVTPEATDFCTNIPGSSAHTNLHVVRISGQNRNVTFLPQNPTGVTAVFNPASGNFDLDPVDFYFSADASASNGTYNVPIVAHTDIKDFPITMTLTIPCP